MHLAIVFGLLTSLSCEQPGTLTAEQETEVRDNVRQLLTDYYDDIRETGLLAEFNYLDSSEDFFWTPPGFISAIAYDSVATILKQHAPVYPSVDNQ